MLVLSAGRGPARRLAMSYKPCRRRGPTFRALGRWQALVHGRCLRKSGHDMGLFDFFSKAKDQDDKAGTKRGKSDREMARFERLVSSKMTQNLDRQDAIRELGEMGNARAARVLLKRFNWSMEPSITDQEEKEAAAAGIVAAGAEALAPIREYCQKAESLHWPLRVLK